MSPNYNIVTVEPTARPSGTWRWQKAYSYAVYVDGRRRALNGSVAPFKVPTVRGGRFQPAKGYEAKDRCARAWCFRWANENGYEVI